MLMKLRFSSLGFLFIVASFMLLAAPSSLAPVGGQATSNRMVLDRGGHDWDEFVWRPSVTYQEPVFSMWYSGEDANGVNSVGVAFSTDGLAWARYDGNPVLVVGPPDAWDSGSVQEAWVIHVGDSYKMWYTGERFDDQGGILSVAIGFATSSDGLHWSKFPGNPVLSPSASGSWDDEWVFRPTVIFTGSAYVMYYQGKSTQSDTYQIGMATSEDGTGWVKLAQPIAIQPAAWNAYSSNLGGIYKIADQSVMLIYGSRSSTELDQIGFAKSPDGITWTTFAASVITPGSIGNWDDAGVILPFLVLAHNYYYIYYTGIQRDFGSRIGVSIIPTSTYPIPEIQAPSLFAAAALLSCMFFLARRKLRRAT